MRIVECGEQGSDEWKAARAGKITASRMAHVIDYLKKGGESQKRAGYRRELLAERLTGIPSDCYVSPAMKWGTETEPLARTAYELATGNFQDHAGFVLHPTMDFAGCSPDGLFGDDGGTQYKCPETTTHIGYLEEGVVPEDYIPQMQWEMACCERQWLDFVSYDPRMLDESLRLFIVRLPRDNAKIVELEVEAMRFEGEIQAEIDKIKSMRGCTI